MRRRVARTMRSVGLETIYRKPWTSQPNLTHKVYPYLLRDRVVKAVDADITYFPMARGSAYLVAIMDWKTEAVSRWNLSSPMDSNF